MNMLNSSTEHPAQTYLALIHAMQKLLAQDYLQGSWLETDRETYTYFASRAAKAGKTKPLSVQKPEVSLQKEAVISRAPALIAAPSRVPEVSVSKTVPEKIMKAAPKPVAKTFSSKFELAAPCTQPHAQGAVDETRAYFQKKFPSISLSDTILDDAIAKNPILGSLAADSEILVLSFSEQPKEQTFLRDLTAALSIHLASATLIQAHAIESENGWKLLLEASKLRHVIANHNALHSLPKLQRYCRDDPGGKHTIGKAQLHLLSDLSIYMQQPALKAALWKGLCQAIHSKNMLPCS